jgi:hypothetical protein
MWCYTTGSQGVIVAEDFHPQNMFLEMQARISGPQDRSETVQLRQIAPRRYQANVPLWGRGRYQVLAIGKSGDRTARAQSGFIVPYSPEYLRFRSNPIVLKEIADKTGGTVLKKETAVEEIYKAHRKPKQSSRPIFDWFLAALAFLLPLDVAFRRIQIDRHSIATLFGWGKSKGDSTATMGTLLQRKKSVERALDAQRLSLPEPGRSLAGSASRPTAGTAPRPEDRPPKKPTETPPKPPEGPDTTTSRLLEMKRKRQQEDKP